MAWTYGGDLENSPRDLVRFLLGDTAKETKFSAADGEIDYWLGLNVDQTTGKPDAYKAASEIANALGNRFSVLAASTVRIGQMALQYDYPAMSERYFALSKRLLAGRTAVAVGAALWDSTKTGSFSMGMMDHP